MGASRPGDIPNSLFMQATNVRLRKDQKGIRGSFLQYSGENMWEAISPTATAGIVKGAWLQTPENFDSTGLADGEKNVSAYGPGCWILAYGTRDGMIPNGRCQLEIFGGRVGFTSVTTTANTAVAVASNVLTVTTAAGAAIEVGDAVVLAGLTGTGAPLNGTYKVASRTATAWTAVSASGDVTVSTTFGTTGQAITAANTNAQFIKVSGSTYIGELKAGEVGIFNLLTGGNAV